MQPSSSESDHRGHTSANVLSAEYFIVMIDYGKSREAIVDPETTRRGAVDLVHEAMFDGRSVSFVHHIHDGVCEDISDEVFYEVMHSLAERGEPLSSNEYEFIESHVSMSAARAFPRAA